MPHRQKWSRARTSPYSALNSFILVFSATILRPLTSARNYATIADRKSANSRGVMNGKNKRKKAMRGGKSGSRSQSGSAGTAPCRRAFGLVFRFILVVFFVACAWLRRPSAKREGLWCGDSRTTMHKSRTCLCQAHATVPNW